MPNTGREPEFLDDVLSGYTGDLLDLGEGP